ncbi:MAG: glutamyl-tRNA reductase [Desulfobacteraceae bacterium]|jgi:glutamyl-tRNA reductase
MAVLPKYSENLDVKNDMREIILLGLNHKTAPVEVRECLAFSGDETQIALEKLMAQPAIKEAVLVSTCNRIEMILAVENQVQAVEAAKGFIAGFKRVPVSEFEKSLYKYCGNEAVKHLFRVASSLDSMMVGEPQILGQIKAAYRTATITKSSGVILNRLLHKAFFVAKRVRSETGIGDHAVSISYAAIELGKKIFGTMENKEVLLIGAGEMAELAVEHLLRNRSGRITVANRTFERGVELAQRFKGRPVRFEEIPHILNEVDIIISSTGSSEFVVRPEQIKPLMRKRRHRPLFFIDIAVPRDIDPAINRISNVYVYDIDDLKGVVDDNIEDRNREALKAERLIDEAVIRFQQWHSSLAVVPTIKDIRKKSNDLIHAEVTKTLNALSPLSEKERKAIEKMAHALVNKILHAPTQFLKQNGCHGDDKAASIDLARKLFDLDT